MPHQPIDKKKRGLARSMRRKPTEAEDRLWRELRARRLDRIKFRRQVPIGSYIADFVCLEARLIVEVDGSQHADSKSDLARTEEMKVRGFRVLRFWNDEVLKDIDGVCDTVMAYAHDRTLEPWR